MPKYDIARTEGLGFKRLSIPVKDFHAPSVEQLARFVDGLEPGTKVILHCQVGTGRTGTFAAAYWIGKGMTASAAISKIRKVRPHAVETAEQKEALGEFEPHPR